MVPMYQARRVRFYRAGPVRSIVRISYLPRGQKISIHKPVTVEEISLATGLPALYIEDEIPRLIYGDALVQNGNKYSANIIILRLEDSRGMIEEFAPYVSDSVQAITESMHENEEKIKGNGFYGCDFGVDRLGYI